jgi:hypothetical protein
MKVTNIYIIHTHTILRTYARTYKYIHINTHTHTHMSVCVDVRIYNLHMYYIYNIDPCGTQCNMTTKTVDALEYEILYFNK